MTEPRTRGPYPSLRLKPAAVPSLARQERMHKEAQECFHDRRPVAAMQGRRSREDKAKDWPTTEMDRGAIHTRGFILGRMKGYVRCDKIMSKFLAERQARVAVEQELAICKQTRGNQLRVAIALLRYIENLRKRNSKLAGILDRRAEPPTSRRKPNRELAMIREDPNALIQAPSPSCLEVVGVARDCVFGSLLNDMDNYCLHGDDVEDKDSQEESPRPLLGSAYVRRTVRTALPKRRLVVGGMLARVIPVDNVRYLSSTSEEDSDEEEEEEEEEGEGDVEQTASPPPKAKAENEEQDAESKPGKEEEMEPQSGDKSENHGWVSASPDDAGTEDDDCVITKALDSKGVPLPYQD